VGGIFQPLHLQHAGMQILEFSSAFSSTAITLSAFHPHFMSPRINLLQRLYDHLHKAILSAVYDNHLFLS